MKIVVMDCEDFMCLLDIIIDSETCDCGRDHWDKFVLLAYIQYDLRHIQQIIYN